MQSIFEIYQDNENQYIKRKIYPKFTAQITFSGKLSDLENIEIDEDIFDAMDIAKALREAGDFILNQSK